MNNKRRHLLGLVAAVTLLALALPAFAQGSFNYRFESLSLAQPDSASPAMLHVAAGQAGFQMSGDYLNLLGVVRCANADPACQTGGLDGQAITISIDGGRGAIQQNANSMSSFYDLLISSLTAGGQPLGSFTGQARAMLVYNEAIRTFKFSFLACGTDGSREIGILLNGALSAPAPLATMLATPGDYPLAWQNLGGTAHLTQDGTSNTICGGRDLGSVFVEEYTPVELPGRESDLPAVELPAGTAARVDRDIVIEATTARLHDQGLLIGVRGYFFGQCGAAPQVNMGKQGDMAQMTIYRAIPEGKTCTGGVESFSLLLPYMEQSNLFKVGDRVPVVINGQIIAILIGL